MSHPDLTAAAHAYAGRGWRVIDLHRIGPDGKTCSCRKGANCGRNAGKHPRNSEWQKSERLSAADIQAIWDVDKAPNIGVATGVDSGLWVLDIDPEGGGFETMKDLVLEHGTLPPTFVVATGSGGYHYYFALPDFELRNSQGRVGQGIDVRAQGGQVVAPPSISGKGRYEIVQDMPLAQAPAWLLELARKDEVDVEIVTAEDLPKPEDIDAADWARYNAYAKRAIDEELARLDRMSEHKAARMEDYRGEPWNASTFEVACALIEFANSPWCEYSLGQAQRDVLAHAPRDSEFDDYTVSKTFASAREKVGQKARQAPEDRRGEPDPLFSGPDVKDHTRGPQEGGEAKSAPLTASVFGGDKGTTPLYALMAKIVMGVGPIGWGQDNAFWTYADGVWKPEPMVVQHRVIDLLGNAYRRSHATNTADIVQRHAQIITADPLEPMMNFRNTMLEWRTGETVDHDPGYGSTVQFGCDWDPEATCERFDAWLAETLHPDYVALAWEMIGYLMLSGNPKHHAFLLYGIGGSGKSTLLKVITTLLGPENIAAETLDDLNGNRFRTASLFGKIANIAGDIDASYQENTATFKRITGQDTVTAEHKNAPPFRFVNWAVPVFSANKIPGSADVTEGYLRRWIILRFSRPVPDEKKVDDFDRELALELPGIAAKGVRALNTLMARGKDGYFDPQGEALAGKEEFAQSIDQVRRWHATAGVLAGPGIQTSLHDLFVHYTQWAERSKQRPVGEVEFAHRVEMLGYPSEKIAGDVFYTGISVPKQPPVTTETYFGGGPNDR